MDTAYAQQFIFDSLSSHPRVHELTKRRPAAGTLLFLSVRPFSERKRGRAVRG